MSTQTASIRGTGYEPSLYGQRVISLESDVASTRTEVAAVAKQTAQAIEELATSIERVRQDLSTAVASLRSDLGQFQQQTRPNLLGIVSAFVAVVSVIGMLSFAFLNARVAPLEHDRANDKEKLSKFEEIQNTRHVSDQNALKDVNARIDRVTDIQSSVIAKIEELQRVVLHLPFVSPHPPVGSSANP